MNTVAPGLRVEKVHVWRGDRHVLRGVSLELGAGELIHVSGANGAGKTTLLRVTTGLLRPEQGSVSWRGKSILQAPTEYQAELAYASHEPALKGDLTALENLRFMVGLKRRVDPAELLGSTASTLDIFSYRHDVVPAVFVGAAVAAARHGAGCALGGGAAIVAVVAGSLFKSDADDGTLEQLALSGQGLTVIVVAKTWLIGW
jgi:ABC-type sugar transport system ATPase subunit